LTEPLRAETLARVTMFASATRLVPIGPRTYRTEVDASWVQGRGVYGGIAAAILVRALEAEASKGQRVVRITTSFCAPLAAGPCRVEVDVVRAGRNVATMRASVWNEGASTPATTCLATLARPREPSALSYRGLVMPEVPPPEALEDGPSELYVPVFAEHFALRQCVGPRSFSGGETACVGGWCRLREDAPVDTALVVAILDAWPPAAVGRASTWGAVASLEMTVHVLEPLPRSAPDPWLYYEARSDHAEHGLADERAVLFDRTGTAIATAQQLVALLPGPIR
jgi:acyl-CoA thioesterase